MKSVVWTLTILAFLITAQSVAGEEQLPTMVVFSTNLLPETVFIDDCPDNGKMAEIYYLEIIVFNQKMRIAALLQKIRKGALELQNIIHPYLLRQTYSLYQFQPPDPWLPSPVNLPKVKKNNSRWLPKLEFGIYYPNPLDDFNDSLDLNDPPQILFTIFHFR